MFEVTEQRPMNNEYVNSLISKLSPLTLAGIFKLYSKFLSRLQTRNHEVNHQIFYSAHFPLSGKVNYVVQELSAECQHAIISWDHYLTMQGEVGSGDSLPILHRTHSDPIPHLETLQSHFQTDGEN